MPLPRKQIPRYRSFSLGDFKEFDRCSFSFFVKHHLGKKYDFEEGSPNKALGSLLDLTIKKIHRAKAYSQPLGFLVNIVKASELEMRDKVAVEGPRSYFGPQIPFLNEDLINKAKAVLSSYHAQLKGRLKPSISSKTFWEYDLIATTGEDLRFWGGPDSIEMGEDGVVEIVDYKYFEDQAKGKDYLDMDLMPKLYTLLVARELLDQGHKRIRFRIRCWQDPNDESLYEEFDLNDSPNYADFFREKAERILRSDQLSFCGQSFCKVCQSDQKKLLEKEIISKSWLKN